jgi:hypothetical protein
MLINLGESSSAQDVCVCLLVVARAMKFCVLGHDRAE